MNETSIIAIVVGVLGLGVIIYFSRKKKYLRRRPASDPLELQVTSHPDDPFDHDACDVLEFSGTVTPNNGTVCYSFVEEIPLGGVATPPANCMANPADPAATPVCVMANAGNWKHVISRGTFGRNATYIITFTLNGTLFSTTRTIHT